MKLQKWLLFFSILYTMNLISTTCQPIINAVSSNPSVFLGKDEDQDFKLHHKVLYPENGEKSLVREDEEKREEEKKYKEVKKMIGSRPPSCENKCFGCMPCQPIQVPATTTSTSIISSRGSLGMQYANYLPEGWKCKCGFTFFTP